MKKHKSILDNQAVRAVLLFAALLAIGLVTRYPALQFPHLYALHGVLAAPLFAAVAKWHFDKKGSIWPLVVASGAMAVLLGIMSPVMGMSFLILAILLLLVWAVAARTDSGKRNLFCAVAFGTLSYPCTLAVGIVSGSYILSFEALPTVFLLFMLGFILSLLAATIVSSVHR